MTIRLGYWILIAAALAGCQGNTPVPPAPQVAVETPPATVAQAAAPPAPDISFAAWLERMRAEAEQRGIRRATIAAALTDIQPIARVIELDNRQPEFSNTFTRYLRGAVSEQRVADGRAMMKKHAALLRRIEKQYGVPARFLVAFWGLETNFGRITGDYPVVAALATLAHDGRREQFFHGEFFNALTIVDRGHIPLEKMKGSWAGAMGQTQFMPSTYLRYAVDEDRNGDIDIWASVADALGSGAHYLQSLGWDGTRTWGREVRLPAKFDVGLASLDVDARENIKSLKQWAGLGVRRTDGGPLPAQDVQAALVLPAGAKGPALLLYENYRVILKWNRSAFYAIAVGHLADRLTGAGGLSTPAAEGEPLRREDVMALQEGLVKQGLLKTADGVLGSGTRQAIRAFQKASGLAPDGYADRNIIAAVKALK